MKKLIASIVFFCLASLMAPLTAYMLSQSENKIITLLTGFFIALLLLIFGIYFFVTSSVIRKIFDWGITVAPVFISLLYTLMPDCIPLPIDDAMVFLAGAMATFGLILRRNPDIPRKTIFTILITAGLTLLGFLIPGSVDEFLIQTIGIIIAFRQMSAAKNSVPFSQGVEQQEQLEASSDNSTTITVSGEESADDPDQDEESSEGNDTGSTG